VLLNVNPANTFQNLGLHLITPTLNPYKKTLFAAALLLAMSSFSFAQVGIGGFVNFGEDVQPLNLSLITSPSKNYGMIFRQGYGFNASQIYRRAETNLVL